MHATAAEPFESFSQHFGTSKNVYMWYFTESNPGVPDPPSLPSQQLITHHYNYGPCLYFTSYLNNRNIERLFEKLHV